MDVRRFDIGEDLPASLAQLVWAWEGLRAGDGLPARAELPPLRLPKPGARASFVLAPDPAAEGGYQRRLTGIDCPAELARAGTGPGTGLADAAFEAWLTRTPMTLTTPAWRALLVPLADGADHVVLGLVVPREIPTREAA